MAAGSQPRRGTIKFVDGIDDDRIVAAIRAAESGTTGQIRVHISNKSSRSVEKAARQRFSRLGMAATPGRNAVLIYLQPPTRSFYIVGDTGCDGCPWGEVAAPLAADLAAGRYTEGLAGAIERTGAILRERFPIQAGEGGAAGLPDEPTRD